MTRENKNARGAYFNKHVYYIIYTVYLKYIESWITANNQRLELEIDLIFK